jgi:ACS family allantoate permease-like MFS transporter
VLLLFLPDSPGTARFLTAAEQQVAQSRVQEQQHSENDENYKREQVVEALIDPKAWFVSLYMLLVAMPSAALSNVSHQLTIWLHKSNCQFSSIIIKGFGFTTLQTLLINMPPAVIVVVLGVGGSWIVGRYPKLRCLVIAAYTLNALVGVLLIRQLPAENRIGRLFGVYLFNSVGATFPIVLSILSSNVTGYTKRTVVNTMFFVGYCVGSIAGPQTFKSSEAPGYSSAYLTLIICLCLGFALSISLRFYMDYENKRRDRKYGVTIDPYSAASDDLRHENSDLTDVQLEQTFRYMI